MISEESWSLSFIFCGNKALVGSERDFRIDDEILPIWEHDEDIGLGSSASIVFETESLPLYDIFTTFFETRATEQVFEDEFAPVSLCF